MGAREAERLIKEHGVKGFKFHPRCRATTPTTRWPGRSTR
jgi:predicted TIM-barrel fold metal-dependent hydrolase